MWRWRGVCSQSMRVGAKRESQARRQKGLGKGAQEERNVPLRGKKVGEISQEKKEALMRSGLGP